MSEQVMTVDTFARAVDQFVTEGTETALVVSESVEEMARRLKDRTHPTFRDAEIQTRVQEQITAWRGPLSYLEPPADVLASMRDHAAKTFDDERRQEASALRAALARLPAAIEARIEAARTLPTLLEQSQDPNYRHDPNLAAVRFFVEADRAERRIASMTRAQLVELYARTPESDATLVRAIEDIALGRSDVRPVEDPAHDAVSLDRLRKAVKGRRERRVPTALLDARTRIEAVRKSGVLDFKLRDLKAVI